MFHSEVVDPVPNPVPLAQYSLCLDPIPPRSGLGTASLLELSGRTNDCVGLLPISFGFGVIIWHSSK